MPKLKPFDLERAIAGYPVFTRDGRKVIEIFFSKLKIKCNILAYIENDGGRFTAYNDCGIYDDGHESDNDLFMAPRAKKLWIAVKKEPFEDGVYPTSWAAESKGHFFNRDYCKTKYHHVEIEVEDE